MSSNDQQATDFASVKNRLAEIADAVSDENLSLDDALDLYEEAVGLGLRASDLLETGIVVPEDGALEADAPAEAADAAESAGAEPAPATA